MTGDNVGCSGDTQVVGFGVLVFWASVSFFDPEYLSAASLFWETLDGQRGPWACLFTLP